MRRKGCGRVDVSGRHPEQPPDEPLFDGGVGFAEGLTEPGQKSGIRCLQGVESRPAGLQRRVELCEQHQQFSTE